MIRNAILESAPNGDRNLNMIAPSPVPAHLRLSEFICGFISILGYEPF